MKRFFVLLSFLKKIKKELITFVCIGGFCSLCFIGSSNLFLFLFGNNIIALFFGNMVGIFCGYFLQMRITFKVDAKHRKMFGRYLILNILLITYSQVVLYICKDYFIPFWLTTLFIAVSIPLFSYPIQKFWVYRE